MIGLYHRLSEGSSYCKKFHRKGGSLTLSELVWYSDPLQDEFTASMLEAYPPMTTVAKCGHMIQEAGYEIAGSFRLPDEAWWKEYYVPLPGENGANGKGICR